MSDAKTRFARRTVLCAACWIVGFLPALSSLALSGALLDIRTGRHGDSLRVVLDLQGDPSCSLERVGSHDDWVVVVRGSCPAGEPPRTTVSHPLLRAIETSCVGSDLYVYLRAARPFLLRSFTLPGDKAMPARFVIDLRPGEPPGAEAEATLPPEPEPLPRRSAGWRVLIDPGHGGRDPGARVGRLKEKEIVLEVARQVAKIVNETPGFEARLSRETDEFLGLRQRREIGEAFEADAFISIHANSFRRSHAKGVEVFFLSLGGASDEASRELARLENEADPGYVLEEDSLLEGIPFSFDLRQSDTLVRSSALAESILSAFEKANLAASRGVKQAGFAVLKSFQVPSILVEVGFLSNPSEAKRLKTSRYRMRLAECIAEGLAAYLEHAARARAEKEAGAP